MTQSLLRFALFALAALASSRACAQSAPPADVVGPLDLPPFRVAVTRVSETRPTPTNSGNTTITFALQAEGLMPSAYVRGIEVTKVRDNLGRDVRPKPPRIDGMIPPGRSLTINVELGAAGRDAESLAFVEGFISVLVTPSVANREIPVDDLPGRTGPLLSPILRMFNIEVDFYSSPAALDRLRAATGIPAPAPAGTSPTLGFLLKDPDDRLQWEWRDADDHALPGAAFTSVRNEEGTSRIIALQPPDSLPPGSHLVLWPDTSPMAKSVPFRVENIPLP